MLVELKALCYRAYVSIHNHPSVNTFESKEGKVSHYDLDEKMISAGYERHKNENKNMLIW